MPSMLRCIYYACGHVGEQIVRDEWEASKLERTPCPGCSSRMAQEAMDRLPDVRRKNQQGGSRRR